jgi:hypothetical protein
MNQEIRHEIVVIGGTGVIGSKTVAICARAAAGSSPPRNRSRAFE